MTPPIFLVLLASALVLFVQVYRGEAPTSVVVALLCIVSALIIIPLENKLEK